MPDEVVRDRREAEAPAARVVGRSLYRQLRSNGYTPRELLAFSTELIALITRDMPLEREYPEH